MATYAETAEKYGITVDQVQVLQEAMATTWSVVEWDWLDCFESDDAALEVYGSEAAMIAEATIDADRVRQFNPFVALDWVYRMPDGGYRGNCLEMAEDVWNSRQ